MGFINNKGSHHTGVNASGSGDGGAGFIMALIALPFKLFAWIFKKGIVGKIICAAIVLAIVLFFVLSGGKA